LGEVILLVEDEEMLLDLLQVFLEENGYNVLVARDGMEAVEIYEKHAGEIKVVLSDMGLPKLGGWEAFRRMKAINPSVRCILASGYFDPDLRADMIKEGALDFVQKPYVPNVILSYITAAIRYTGNGPLGQ
jgi:DNA-binding NtrC family response regulator